MSNDPVRQHHKLATGKGLDSPPPKTANPGFKKGGPIRKQSGGTTYRKGGKTR